MRLFAARVRFWCALTAATWMLSGCGGSSVKRADGGGGDGAGATTGGDGTGGGNGATAGNTALGGSVAHGGSFGVGAKGGTAGVGAGGNGSGGDIAGSAGSGGGGSGGISGSANGGGGSGNGGGGTDAGGAAGFDCYAPPAPTRRECVFEFYVDQETRECTPAGPFVCLTNANRFHSLSECLSLCEDTKPAMNACDRPADCMVVSSGCCGLCLDAPIETAMGVNGVRVGAGDHRPCGDVQCEPCPEVPVDSQISQYYFPTCTSGECGVVDLRTTEYTACSEDSDCFLRSGTGCCPRCDAHGFAALSSTAFLDGQCEGVGCPDCLTPTPTDIVARCVSGRCVIEPSDAGG